MDCRLGALIRGLNFSDFPQDVANQINKSICNVCPEGVHFDKIERMGVEKFLFAIRVIFTLGICLVYYKNQYHKALKTNNVKKAAFWIKRGANPHLKVDKIEEFVRLRREVTLHFAVSQAKFSMPVDIGCGCFREHFSYGESSAYWTAAKNLRGDDKHFLLKILGKESQRNSNMSTLLALFNQNYLNSTRHCPPRIPPVPIEVFVAILEVERRNGIRRIW